MTEPSLKFGRLGEMALCLAKNLAGGEDSVSLLQKNTFGWRPASCL